MAGMVTPTPKAIDSPGRAGGLHDVVLEDGGVLHAQLRDASRKSVMEMTATGIEALTVSPTFSTR